MIDFFETQKKVNDLQDIEQKYYDDFKINLKEYKAPHGFVWYSKAEIDARLKFFLKKILEAKNKEQEQMEFSSDINRRNVAFGNILAYDNVKIIFEESFGRKE